MMSAAVERIVVQATAGDKRAIAEKARRLDMPVSELMRRGAFAYDVSASDEALGVLADAARAAAERSSAAIDDALAFIEASDRRLDKMAAGSGR
jgi:hypothetical protein